MRERNERGGAPLAWYLLDGWILSVCGRLVCRKARRGTKQRERSVQELELI